jgi:hypothetical protein
MTDPNPHGLLAGLFTPERIAARKAQREAELAEAQTLAELEARALQNWTNYDPTRPQ